MRILPDTNVIISFLLNPQSPAPPAIIIRSALAGSFAFVASEGVFAELRRTCSEKPYLASRIARSDVDELTALLRAIADKVVPVTESITAISRDRNDDFLILDALLGQADYLVSGDPDLLVLGEYDGVQIVSPAEFVAILDALG